MNRPREMRLYITVEQILRTTISIHSIGKFWIHRHCLIRCVRFWKVEKHWNSLYIDVLSALFWRRKYIVKTIESWKYHAPNKNKEANTSCATAAVDDHSFSPKNKSMIGMLFHSAQKKNKKHTKREIIHRMRWRWIMNNNKNRIPHNTRHHTLYSFAVIVLQSN